MKDLKKDMLRLIFLSAEISKLDQMYLFHSNLKDKYNYDFEKCEIISKVKNSLAIEFETLNKKWF